MLVGRRSVVLGLLATPSLLVARSLSAGETVVPSIPLAFGVAQELLGEGDKAATVGVVTRDFIDAQLAQANTIFGEHGVAFHEARDLVDLPQKTARLESATDRDAMSEHMQKQVVNIFFVASLRDVDDKKVFRMGVTWRKLSDLSKKYIIVAASALPTTMAHELGHYLGNDHSSVKNNLMSYDREPGAKVFLDDKQGEKARKTALALFAKKTLA
ncbi:MAG: hypothetical protein U0271_47280 [Polyangiaceae bacterium]